MFGISTQYFPDAEGIRTPIAKSIRRISSLPDLKIPQIVPPLLSLKGESLKSQFPFRLQLEENKKEEFLKKKSSVMWDCVDYLNGCFVFRARDLYNDISFPDIKSTIVDNIKRIKQEIYPAVEASPSKLFKIGLFSINLKMTKKDFLVSQFPFFLKQNPEHLSLHPRLRKLGRSHFIAKYANLYDLSENFQHLGYKLEKRNRSVFLFLPTQETILKRWKQEWPRFDILKMKGSATPITFIESYLTHDSILSEDKEYVHDHLIHLVSSLAAFFLYGLNNRIIYQKERARLAKAVAINYRLILLEEKRTPLEPLLIKMKLALSALVDVILSRAHFDHDNDYLLNKHFTFIWIDPLWAPYWSPLFKNEKAPIYENLMLYWQELRRRTPHHKNFSPLPQPLEKKLLPPKNRFEKKVNSSLFKIEENL